MKFSILIAVFGLAMHVPAQAAPERAAGPGNERSQQICEKQEAQCLKQCDKEKMLWFFKGEAFENCADKCAARHTQCLDKVGGGQEGREGDGPMSQSEQRRDRAEQRRDVAEDRREAAQDRAEDARERADSSIERDAEQAGASEERHDAEDAAQDAADEAEGNMPEEAREARERGKNNKDKKKDDGGN